MDFFKQLLPGQQQQSQQQGDAGLLADWQAYSGQPGDVESGGTAAKAGSQIARTAEEVGSSITGFLRSGYTAVSDGLGNVQATAENT